MASNPSTHAELKKLQQNTEATTGDKERREINQLAARSIDNDPARHAAANIADAGARELASAATTSNRTPNSLGSTAQSSTHTAETKQQRLLSWLEGSLESIPPEDAAEWEKARHASRGT